MAKKSRRDKEVARLRREVEVLRAQLAGQKAPPAAEVSKESKPAETPKTTREPKVVKALKTQTIIQSVDPKYIKADLLKSAVLALLACGIIIALSFLL